jgi:hypothetical protein
VLAAASGPCMGAGSFGSVHDIVGSKPALCVKRVKAPSGNTLKEGALLRGFRAMGLDFVCKLYDSFVEGDSCYFVMEKGAKTLDDCLKAKVRALPASHFSQCRRLRIIVNQASPKR